MSKKYLWVENLESFLWKCCNWTAWFIARVVCFFRGHDFEKYTLTVCNRCGKIASDKDHMKIAKSASMPDVKP